MRPDRNDGRLSPYQANIVEQWAQEALDAGLSEKEALQRCLAPLQAPQEGHVREIVAAVFEVRS